jgi:hypothetical protein
MPSTPDAYQEHIDRLARELGCRVDQRPKMPGMMYVELGYVEGPTIENQRDYLAVLHELGHFALGHTQGRPPHPEAREYFSNGVLRSEAQAWEWAMNECQDNIEDSSRRFMWDFCLGSYYVHSLRIGTKPTRMPNGGRHHIEFVFDVPDHYFASVVKQIQGYVTDWKIPFLGPGRHQVHQGVHDGSGVIVLV